jgi:hypothetical protein
MQIKIKKLFKIKLVRLSLALFVLDLIFFGGLNSSRVSQIILEVGYVTLLANIYLLSYGLTSLIRLYGLVIKNPKRFSIYTTSFLGVIIGLQSVGELSGHDIIVVLLLAVGSYSYLNYVSKTRQKPQKL